MRYFTLVLTLFAAAPHERDVRRGNAALAKGDLAAALAAYDRAEERATDPGLVAFNKGVALYHKGEFASAEAHFRRAREDAEGGRRAAAAYDLAGCLVRRAGERDYLLLEEAISLYRQCLSNDDLDARFARDARHNLELAKTLWLSAKARADERKDDRPPNDDDAAKPPPKPDNRSAQPEPGAGQAKAGFDKSGARPEKGADAAQGEERPDAGKGELNAIPDQADMAPMTQKEALQHLQQAAARVFEERKAHRQRGAKMPSGKVRDW